MQGKPGTPWNFTVQLPRPVQRKLKVYCAENDVEIRDIGIRALELWAAEAKVELPPLEESEPGNKRDSVVID